LKVLNQLQAPEKNQDIQSLRQKLLGGLEPWNFMTFHILGIIVLTNSIIFQRGRLKPPTRKSLAFQLVGGSLIPLAGFMM
jgi:hypothetical protein